VTYNNKKQAATFLPLFILLFTGLVAVTASIGLFGKTVASWTLFVFVFLFSGFLVTPINSFFLEKHGKLKSYLLKVAFNIAAFGGMFAGLLTALNYYIREGHVRAVKAEIIKVGFERSRGKTTYPYAEVRIGKTSKDLRFPYGSELDRYSYVVVELERGVLGFDVIVNWKGATE
jgi:hypothetical protein